MNRLIRGRAGPLSEIVAEARAVGRRSVMLAEMTLLTSQLAQLQAANRSHDTADKAYAIEQRLNTLVNRLLGFGPDGAGAASYVGGDGNTYTAGQIILRYTGSALTINSTSGTTPAGMSCPVGARTYFVSGVIAGQQGATAAVQAIRLTGPAAAAVLAGYLVSNFGDFGAAGIASNFSQVSALNTDLSTSGAGGGINANANFQWMLMGEMTFSATGTFALQARCVTSNLDPWTFQPNSHVILYPC